MKSMDLVTVDNVPERLIVSKEYTLPNDYITVVPEITSDPDVDLMNHQTNLTIYTRSQGNLPNEYFIQPSFVDAFIQYDSESINIDLPVFEPVVPYEPSQEELETFFTNLFSNILSKGDTNQVYQLLMEIDTEAFVNESGLKLLLIPGKKESTLELMMNILPSTRNLFNIIYLRSKFNRSLIPIQVIEDVLTDTQYIWELPKDKEVIEYSLDRIPKTDSICHPVDQKGQQFSETTAGKANKYISIADVPETFNDSGLAAEDIFSVFVVYLEPLDDRLVLKIAFARINFAEIGSKHAHVVVNMLPNNFHYLFSGEMIIENGVFSYNLNSGMFYHLHKAPGMKRNFTLDVSSYDHSLKTDEYNYVRGFLFSNTLHWEEFSRAVMESLLEKPVQLKGNIRRSKMKLTQEQLSEYCIRKNFSFKTFPNKKSCESGTGGKDVCEQGV